MQRKEQEGKIKMDTNDLLNEEDNKPNKKEKKRFSFKKIRKLYIGLGLFGITMLAVLGYFLFFTGVPPTERLPQLVGAATGARVPARATFTCYDHNVRVRASRCRMSTSDPAGVVHYYQWKATSSTRSDDPTAGSPIRMNTGAEQITFGRDRRARVQVRACNRTHQCGPWSNTQIIDVDTNYGRRSTRFTPPPSRRAPVAGDRTAPTLRSENVTRNRTHHDHRFVFNDPSGIRSITVEPAVQGRRIEISETGTTGEISIPVYWQNHSDNPLRATIRVTDNAGNRQTITRNLRGPDQVRDGRTIYNSRTNRFYVPPRQICNTGTHPNCSGSSGSRGSGIQGLHVVFGWRVQNFMRDAAEAGHRVRIRQSGDSPAFRSLNLQRTPERMNNPGNASPGLSYHGWGLAVDFSFGSPGTMCSSQEQRRLFSCNAAARWAHQNAGRYGIVFPLRGGTTSNVIEPWHAEARTPGGCGGSGLRPVRCGNVNSTTARNCPTVRDRSSAC